MIIIVHVTASVGSAATARRPATAIGRDSPPSCQRRKKHRKLRGIAPAQRPTYSGVAMAAGRGTVQSLKEGEKEKGEEEAVEAWTAHSGAGLGTDRRDQHWLVAGDGACVGPCATPVDSWYGTTTTTASRDFASSPCPSLPTRCSYSGWLLVAPTAALFLFRYQNAKYKIFINCLHDILNIVKK